MNESNNDKFSQHLEENVIKRKQLKEEKKKWEAQKMIKWMKIVVRNLLIILDNINMNDKEREKKLF